MPLYDCGHRDCDECQRAFGPDRADAIRRYEVRRLCMDALAVQFPLPPLKQEHV
nr:hypothetical protein [uncultured Lichenicoccus sp.]